MPVFLRLSSFLLLSAFAAAQAPPTSVQQNPSDPGFTLNVSTRLVIEDVTVSDRKGNPVLNLPKSAFHVTDDNAAQGIADFREQSTPAVTTVSSSQAPGTATGSSRSILRGPGTTVAILIDPMSLELPDQMYLRVQAMHFLELVPEGVKVAIFRANNKGIPVLLQGPTEDRALLKRAMQASVPVIARPIDSAFVNAVTELGNLTDYLRQFPGNKAVLWLAGEFPLYQRPDVTLNGGDRAGRADILRAAYRAMDQARVAVYPIDARGVQMGGLPPTVVFSTAAAAQDPSSIPHFPAGESAQAVGQYNQMDFLASATGGSAFYSTNAIATAMQMAMRLASESYSLSYRPTNYVQDGHWHKVKVTVDGPYVVHYRQGYYADGRSDTPAIAASRVVIAGVEDKGSVGSDGLSDEPGGNGYGAPLLFGAKIRSEAKSGKGETVGLRYVIPTRQLQFDNGSGHARFRLAVLAYNAWGDVLGKGVEIIETHYTPEQMQLAGRIGAPADQTVDVPKGAQYLLLAVQDMNSSRVGTVQLQLGPVGASAASAATSITP